jgi:hypothetical protein
MNGTHKMIFEEMQNIFKEFHFEIPTILAPF